MRRALAWLDITVLLNGSGQFRRHLTDAFGRYQFSSLDSVDYQLVFEDENIIFYLDEDPYPDDGTVYLNPTTPVVTSLSGNENVSVADFILQRVEVDDARQAMATVNDCSAFGDATDPQSLSHAIENARRIVIQCNGVLPVPEIVVRRDLEIHAPNGISLEAEGDNRIFQVRPIKNHPCGRAPLCHQSGRPSRRCAHSHRTAGAAKVLLDRAPCADHFYTRCIPFFI